MHAMALTTGVIDWPSAIEAVEKAMQGAALECRFHGNRREKGTFTFRLPDMTLDEFDALASAIAGALRSVDYQKPLEIEISSDDEPAALRSVMFKMVINFHGSTADLLREYT